MPSTYDEPSPVRVHALSAAGHAMATVSCGARHTAAVSTTGALWLWGMVSLGDGIAGRHSWTEPVHLPVVLPEEVAAAAAAGGMTPTPELRHPVDRVCCGAGFTLATLNDGRVVAWGVSGVATPPPQAKVYSMVPVAPPQPQPRRLATADHGSGIGIGIGIGSGRGGASDPPTKSHSAADTGDSDGGHYPNDDDDDDDDDGYDGAVVVGGTGDLDALEPLLSMYDHVPVASISLTDDGDFEGGGGGSSSSGSSAYAAPPLTTLGAYKATAGSPSIALHMDPRLSSALASPSDVGVGSAPPGDDADGDGGVTGDGGGGGVRDWRDAVYEQVVGGGVGGGGDGDGDVDGDVDADYLVGVDGAFGVPRPPGIDTGSAVAGVSGSGDGGGAGVALDGSVHAVGVDDGQDTVVSVALSEVADLRRQLVSLHVKAALSR